jgi:hypothetical protein
VTETAAVGREVHPSRRWWWVGGIVAVVAVIVVAIVVATGGGGTPAAVDTPEHPVVVMTPSPTSVTYHDGEKITLSVAANKIFSPYSRIVVLECADPGGQVANLPVNDSTCDGNTVNPYSILVNKDGSFSTGRYHMYQMFVLPNRSLGEDPAGQPVCNATHSCVLYVGQDQNNFKSPKVFSVPFTISGSGASGATP